MNHFGAVIHTAEGAALLLLIRDAGPIDFQDLCQALHEDSGSSSSVYVRLKLEKLERAGLIRRDDADRYQISPTWSSTQSALDISLTKAAALGPSSMVVQPFLGPPDTLSAPTDVFVVMPFAGTLRPIWEDHIKAVTVALDLSASRADDFFTSHAIVADVWNAVCNARVVVADCTGRNPNVFYEIGLAHVVGKPVILITADESDVPFDLRHYRYIAYDYTPRGMQVFEAALRSTLVNTLNLEV